LYLFFFALYVQFNFLNDAKIIESQATQTCTQFTQIYDPDENEERSRILSPSPPRSPINLLTVPWGRLVPSNNSGGVINLLPRDPLQNIGSVTRSKSLLSPEQPYVQSGTKSISFLGLRGLKLSDRFNEYVIGRSVQCDVVVSKSEPAPKDKEWIHALISNKHCHLFCMLKNSPGATAMPTHSAADMEVYVEDSSSNGTLVNNTVLLKRGERRMLHNGDTISLLNPAIVRKKVRGVMEQKDILSHYSFIFINLHQTQRGFANGAEIGSSVSDYREPLNIKMNGDSGVKQINRNLFLQVATKEISPLSYTTPASCQVKNGGLVDVRATNTRPNQKRKNNMSPPSEKRLKVSPLISREKYRRIEEIYDLRDEIGSGTRGKVRRAIHRQTGQVVAIKIIPFGKLRNRNQRSSPQSIEAEALILQSLNHPYIVPLFDFFINSGTAVYLVMELSQGGDLFDRIIQKGKYNEVESRRVMRRLLAALHYLHQDRGIVHRDLKPENILCASSTDDITVKLTDFDLAKSITDDGLKTFCGTPQYFAPEVLRRRHSIAGRGRYGKEADMWSLGVILYILLSGTPPFDTSDNIDAVAEANITFCSEEWRAVSDSAKDFVASLLEIDPTKRICVVNACSHRWILTEDGDTHLHPLQDPVLQDKKEEKKTPTRIKEDKISIKATSVKVKNSIVLPKAFELLPAAQSVLDRSPVESIALSSSQTTTSSEENVYNPVAQSFNKTPVSATKTLNEENESNVKKDSLYSLVKQLSGGSSALDNDNNSTNRKLRSITNNDIYREDRNCSEKKSDTGQLQSACNVSTKELDQKQDELKVASPFKETGKDASSKYLMPSTNISSSYSKENIDHNIVIKPSQTKIAFNEELKVGTVAKDEAQEQKNESGIITTALNQSMGAKVKQTTLSGWLGKANK